MTEVAKISLALVYWTAKQIDMQYRSAGSGVIVVWEDLFDTDRDWWVRVLQMEPFPGGETMPQAMMEFLIHERGFPCGVNKQERTFPKPDGYVEWKEKLRCFKACAGYQPPRPGKTASRPK